MIAWFTIHLNRVKEPGMDGWEGCFGMDWYHSSRLSLDQKPRYDSLMDSPPVRTVFCYTIKISLVGWEKQEQLFLYLVQTI